jgi:hypothetical protein
MSMPSSKGAPRKQRKFQGGTFLMTSEQHRRRAEQLRASNPELAKHHENLAKLIESQQRTGVVIFGRARPYVASPPLSPYGRFRSD